MSNGLVLAAYIIAAMMFILSLAGLSNQETARNGNKFGIIGMVIALSVTILSVDVQSMIYILVEFHYLPSGIFVASTISLFLWASRNFTTTGRFSV